MIISSKAFIDIKKAAEEWAKREVVEVTQSIIDEYFAMYMMVDITDMNIELDKLRTNLKEGVKEMEIHVMHEDIFNSMHRI